MVKCTTCGNDSEDVATWYWKEPLCHNPDCKSGWVKCTRCTYGPGGYMLKCCGFCGGDGKPAGQRKCDTCKGKGKLPAIRHACDKPHKRSTPTPLPTTSGARSSSAGRGAPSAAGRGAPAAVGRGAPAAAGRGGPGRRP